MGNNKIINFSEIKRILLINMGGVGDIILFTPVLKALKHCLPYGSITLITGEPGIEKVIAGSGLIDKVILCDRKKRRSIAQILQLINTIKKERFDLALIATGTNSFNGSLLTYLAGIPYRIGENINHLGMFYTTKVSYDKERHELEGNLDLLKAAGIEINDKNPFVYISRDDEKFAEQFFLDNKILNKPIICLHVGPAAPDKNFRRWSGDKFAELANKLTDLYQAKIILVGGNEEIDLVNKILSLFKSQPVISTGKTSIGQMAALIKKADLFIGNDSGPMHIAGAVATPTVAIFGPTNTKDHHPCGNKFIIVRKNLKCSPCYYRGKVKCKKLDCFKSITGDEVLKAVDEILKKFPINA